jgi:hypothetical protein
MLTAHESAPLNFTRAKPRGFEARPCKLQQCPLSNFMNAAAPSTADTMSMATPDILINKDFGRAVANVAPTSSDGPGEERQFARDAK